VRAIRILAPSGQRNDLHHNATRQGAQVPGSLDTIHAGHAEIHHH
jgi:hypothetical protein